MPAHHFQEGYCLHTTCSVRLTVSKDHLISPMSMNDQCYAPPGAKKNYDDKMKFFFSLPESFYGMQAVIKSI